MKHYFQRLVGCMAACLTVFLMTGDSHAQIVNVQPLVAKSNADGFQLELGGSFSWSTGNVDLILAKGSLLMLYRKDHHKLISSSSGELGISGGDQILERLFSHLRWQWSVSRLITWETYAQVANDKFRRLALRTLAGTGPRFEFVKGPAVNFALGLSYMFEHEKLGESTFSDSHRSDNNHRASLYYTGSFAVSPLLSLVNTTYYQPRLDAFLDDYRISTEVSLVVKLSKKLALKLAFKAYYDSEPPEGVKAVDTGTNVSLKLGL